MAKLQAEKLNLSSINNGNEYANGTILSADTVNAMLKGIAYAQNPFSSREAGQFVVIGDDGAFTTVEILTGGSYGD